MKILIITLALLLSGLISQAGAARSGLHVFSDPQLAPAIELSDKTGTSRSLSAYRGRTVIVNFWASWCSPCRREMPSLQATAQRYADNRLIVLAVSLDDSWEDAENAMQGYEDDFVVLLDQGGETSARWMVNAVPTAFVIDHRGDIRLRIVGGYDWQGESLLRHFDKLTREDGRNADDR